MGSIRRGDDNPGLYSRASPDCVSSNEMRKRFTEVKERRESYLRKDANMSIVTLAVDRL